MNLQLDIGAYRKRINQSQYTPTLRLQQILSDILAMGKGRGGGRNGKNNGHIRSGKNYNGGGSYSKTTKPKPKSGKRGKGNNS